MSKPADVHQLANSLSFFDIGALFVEKVLSCLPSSGPFVALLSSHYEIPTYHLIFEAVLVIVVIVLLLRKSYSPDQLKDKKVKLTPKEIDELIADWKPEPLVALDSPETPYMPVIEGHVGKYVKIDGEEKLNLGSFNFLGFVENKEIKETAMSSLRKYGVGSCGPRGFYGTIDVHLQLEEQLAKFTKTEEVVIYSYAFSTVASVIPAYAKRGDILFVDEGVSFAIHQGVVASRSTVKYFKHNDVKSLETLLQEQQKEDENNPQKAKTIRQFIVIEGLYPYFGDIAPLKEIVDLKYKYKVRIMLDESFSFGVLGKTGRGLTEHANVSVEHIDIGTSSMETSLGSIGGFAFGRTFVVDHQRLSSQGYCFSASLPPLLASAALKSLEIMGKNPSMFTELASKSTFFRKELNKSVGAILQVCGSDFSPIIPLTLKDKSRKKEEASRILDSIVSECMKQGIAVTRARFIDDFEPFAREPTIRITLSISHTSEELERAAQVLGTAAIKAARP